MCAKIKESFCNLFALESYILVVIVRWVSVNKREETEIIYKKYTAEWLDVPYKINIKKIPTCLFVRSTVE